MRRNLLSDSHAKGREKHVKPFAQYMNQTVKPSVTMPVFVDHKFSEKVTVTGEAR